MNGTTKVNGNEFDIKVLKNSFSDDCMYNKEQIISEIDEWFTQLQSKESDAK